MDKKIKALFLLSLNETRIKSEFPTIRRLSAAGCLWVRWKTKVKPDLCVNLKMIKRIKKSTTELLK